VCDREVRAPFDGEPVVQLVRKVYSDHVVFHDGDEAFAPGIGLRLVPGHTAGSAVLLYRETFLFTGDHLMGSEDDGRLHAGRDVCWYSWPEQIRSMEKLLAYDFEWVLPGHGDMHHDSGPNMKSHLERCIAWMKTRN